MDEMRILSPTATLGYGFPLASFEEGLARRPHVVAVDAGSSEAGPHYLGAGVPPLDREAVKRDLKLILLAASSRGIPVIVGTAGGAGARKHLDWTADIVREIAVEDALTLRLALIDSELDKSGVLKALETAQIVPCDGVPTLTESDVRSSAHIVAQLGMEPIIRALKLQATVVLAGRAFDPAVFAAYPVLHGFDKGLALHLGKILECAAIACSPPSASDCLLGVLKRDSFEVHPLNSERKCTVTSVASHSLFEKADPYHLPGPGGVLDLTDAQFEQIGDGVQVSGSKHVGTPYAVKLEGARRVGHRFVALAGVRDPQFVANADSILQRVRQAVSERLPEVSGEDFHLAFRTYGRNGVLGASEPNAGATSNELGIVIEAVAESAVLAKAICAAARNTLHHFEYPGRLSTAGNLAIPFSPADLDGGEVYAFSVYHLMHMDDPSIFFPTIIENIGERRVALK